MIRVKEVVPELENQEVSDFAVDAFLSTIPRPLVKQELQCPHCLVDMTFGSIQHEDGTQWEYYRCPMTRFGTKCYVTCGKGGLC